MAKFVGGLLWGVLDIGLANISSLADTARLSTPDSLSTFLIVAGLFLLIEKRLLIPGYMVLILSALARPENIILAVVLIVYLNVAGPREYAIATQVWAGLVGLSVLVYFLANAVSGFYGWWTVFFHSFSRALATPTESTPAFDLARYANIVFSQFRKMVMLKSGLAIAGIYFALACGSSALRFRAGSIYGHVALGMVIALLPRLFLYPLWEDPYFASYFVMGLILFLGARSDQQRELAGQRRSFA